MEAQTVAAFATDEVYGTEEQQPSTILVVNELLAAFFAGDEALLIAEPKECISSDRPGLESGQNLVVHVNSEDIVADERTVEISLYGTVKNESGRERPFTLYFFLWVAGDAETHGVHSLLEPGARKLFAVDLPWPGGEMREAVFKLDLRLETPAGSRQQLGRGRGAWVFRQKEWEMEIG
jgi:hypothetical protein